MTCHVLLGANLLKAGATWKTERMVFYWTRKLLFVKQLSLKLVPYFYHKIIPSVRMDRPLKVCHAYIRATVYPYYLLKVVKQLFSVL